MLAIDGLSKSFGTQKVIDNLSLSVPEGAIFGFIGQNGSGKTTTMKMVLGLLKADNGTIQVCGETVNYGQTKTNRHIGYLPDVPEFYNYMRPLEYLALCSEIAGLSKSETMERSDELLALVGLAGLKKRIGGFSRGMKQRLGIAQALLSHPALLICDEPTSALDPVGRKEILEILMKIKGSTTVIFSTHILSDVERICDRVAVLHNGGIAVSGTLSEIKALHGQDSLFLQFSANDEVERFIACETISPLLLGAEVNETEIALHGADMNYIQHSVIAALAQLCLCPSKMELAEPTLENLFLEVVQ
ncbi:MAG: ABC transporter ATP-binding protein [Propionibacteriaceae bacterium]|nr:ABC transporter ATP-binding protein [Propionibacteriaceae bacterium]